MFPFSRTILDFLFPPFCVGCGKDNAWLCRGCLDEVPFLEPDDQDACHLAPYAHPTVRKLVTNLKYHSATCLIESIRHLLERYPAKPNWTGPLSIVSVPASERRLRERGIDQAAIIADLLQQAWFRDAQRVQLLTRIKHTTPNARLEDPKARQGNMSGAFAANGSVRGSLILVDDVYTSGATMNECRDVLKNAGAEHVHLFTIAKG